ncbi:protein PLASTID MOVEMENT IMPAIRED 1-RELATED 1-like isoform X2 [Malania oleifera]|nr:protein PLASTID MOVEMENT IMPAIRED 1-RELATED 1-like isoform X2 [Malania oleifera]XP_057960107.1 protein PLASTID MOVEMENT IMPAIRED 1-RELATED 1-like isoform X2 [Malania oleifera]
MHRCSVYGSRSAPHQAAKYEAKHFLVYASVVEVPRLEVGKHWVDLTKLLPRTFEELEDDKSLGKWTMSFELSGRAKGATLNVSFGFLVVDDNSFQLTRNPNVPELLNLSQNRRSSVRRPIGRFSLDDANGMLRRLGSVPDILNHGSHILSQSTDVKSFHKILPDPQMGLSRSINFLYEKLDEGKKNNAEEIDMFPEQMESLKPKPHSFSDSTISFIENDADFTIIDQGIEFSTEEPLKFKEGAVQIFDGAAVETIHVDEIINGGGVAVDSEAKGNPKDETHENYKDEVVVKHSGYRENNTQINASAMANLVSAFQSPPILASADLEDEFLPKEENLEIKSCLKSSKMVKSCSLDDVTDSLTGDFLNMWGTEHSPFGLSSDGEPDSPRERLLRQFEKDVVASGNFIFDFDAQGVLSEFSCAGPPGFRLEDFSEDFNFSMISQAAEKDRRASQSLKSKRNAKMLEDLETKALMLNWGLNEEAFQSSPRYSSGGFGSPVYLPPDEPGELPPLGEGLGPFVWVKSAGFLRSMSPSLFRNAENGGNLIIQASGAVVLPAEMGSDVMEVIQHLALVGIGKLSMQVNKLMPLEDITGKVIQHVVQDAASRWAMPESQVNLQCESEAGQDSSGEGKKAVQFPSVQNYDDLKSSSTGSEMGLEYVSLEDLAPLAMDKIEVLSIEGLRIQSGMSAEEAPSCIRPNSAEETLMFDGKCANFNTFSLKGAIGDELLDVKDGGHDADGLLDLSITLDEWMKLDAGIVGGDHIGERISKILAAHHAKYADLIGGRLTKDGKWGRAFGGNCGLMGNSLTVALMVQLRDPFRNYEPIGAPMFAIIRAERDFVPLMPKICSSMLGRSNHWEGENQYELMEKEGSQEGNEKTGKEGIPQFKLTEVHLAGLNPEPAKKQLWGSTTQQQSGSRWLLASGMGKTNKHAFSKSKAIVKFSSQVMTKVLAEDTFWSISSCVHSTRAERKGFAALNSHIRNPDVIFPNETIRLRV